MKSPTWGPKHSEGKRCHTNTGSRTTFYMFRFLSAVTKVKQNLLHSLIQPLLDRAELFLTTLFVPASVSRQSFRITSTVSMLQDHQAMPRNTMQYIVQYDNMIKHTVVTVLFYRRHFDLRFDDEYKGEREDCVWNRYSSG